MEENMSRYLDFNDDLLGARSYQASFDAYDAYLRSLGFKSMSHAYMPNNAYKNQQNNTPKFATSKDYGNGFIPRYTERQYQQYDYIIDALKKGQTGLMLWQRDFAQLNRYQQRILNIMKTDYQMGNGFSIPTAAGKQGIGAVSIIGDENDRLFSQLIEEHFREIASATNNFHNHVKSKNYDVAVFIMTTTFLKLTKTEKSVLKYLLDGFSVPVIATKVFRCKKYVEKLVSNIRIKIGGENADGKPRISKDELIHFCGLMRIYDEL